MKKFALVFGLVLSTGLSAAQVFNSDNRTQMVLQCTTNENKVLAVSLDKKTNELYTAYGDGKTPDHGWGRNTNDIFWNRTAASADPKVTDTELYIDFEDEWLTLTFTDTPGETLVTVRTEDTHNNVKMIDSCKSIDTLAMNDTVTANMIWVSNNGEE